MPTAHAGPSSLSFPRLQVGSGPHSFTYDHVFGGDSGQDSTNLYGRCVEPLVDGLFKGYNATASPSFRVQLKGKTGLIDRFFYL